MVVLLRELLTNKPMTKEESDRREAANNQIRLVQDTMGLVSDIEDNIIKLKMLLKKQKF